ncbi:MAG: SpoIIE family protein phosphatase [Rikenellaceae bacterium]
MSTNNNFISTDVSYHQQNHRNHSINGDKLLSHYFEGESRFVMVLCDGLGSGKEANMMSKLVAERLLDFNHTKESISRVAADTLNSLPLTNKHGICYSTFSLIDINLSTSQATIIEYDNPECIVLRGNKIHELDWQYIEFNSNICRHKTIRKTTIELTKGDRLIIMSDGVTQSGIGSIRYPFGWQREEVVSHVSQELQTTPNCPSKQLSHSIINKSIENDNNTPQDDISCGVITIL